MYENFKTAIEKKPMSLFNRQKIILKLRIYKGFYLYVIKLH